MYKDLRKNYFEKLQCRLVTNIMNVRTVDAATFKQKKTTAQRMN
jgi:hypothetical protein